jgi:hypothetical protein
MLCQMHVLLYIATTVEQCDNISGLMHILSAYPYLGKIIECITRLYSTIAIQSTAISTTGTTRCIQLLFSGKALQ